MELGRDLFTLKFGLRFFQHTSNPKHLAIFTSKVIELWPPQGGIVDWP